jgi:hypothetical protein
MGRDKPGILGIYLLSTGRNSALTLSYMAETEN